MKNEGKSSFTKFSIVDFYPSILKYLLTNAINFASTVKTVGKEVIDTNMHSRK